MLKLDAVQLALTSGVGPVDPQGVFAFPNGFRDHFDAVGLDRGPFLLLGCARLEVAAPEDFSGNRGSRD